MNARQFTFDADMSDLLSRENDEADETAKYAIRFIASIPQPLFSERVAMSLICALQARIATANWTHMEHAQTADEYLTDAHLVLENAADAMTQAVANEVSA